MGGTVGGLKIRYFLSKNSKKNFLDFSLKISKVKIAEEGCISIPSVVLDVFGLS
jgi:hypothetical protein